MARGSVGAALLDRDADQHGAHDDRAEPDHAGGSAAGRRRRLRRRTGRGLLYDTKQAGRHYIADRGLASIGYGLPGGIGASLAAPDRPVVALTGDGGFNMSIGDLETARRSGAASRIIVVNNAASGYVKALQHSMYGGRYQSSDLAETNYAKVAEALGCLGIRVEDPEELRRRASSAASPRRRPDASSTSSSPATRPRCCPASTAACSRSRRATPVCRPERLRSRRPCGRDARSRARARA